MTTELMMKESLDGWFFTYNCTNQSVTKRKVPKDHIPSHKPKMMEDHHKPKTAYKWSEREDDLLVELRHRNLSWRQVGKYLRMSQTAVRNRYLELCLKREIPEYRLVQRPPEVDEMERRIMALRAKDKSFSEIAAVLDITRNKVAGIVQRVRRRRDFEEMAA